MSALYLLPKTDKFSDTQHEAHRASMDGLYPRACSNQVFQVLSPSPGETKKIMDLGGFLFSCYWNTVSSPALIGSGSGAWYLAHRSKW
jgi:hypothetical protein